MFCCHRQHEVHVLTALSISICTTGRKRSHYLQRRKNHAIYWLYTQSRDLIIDRGWKLCILHWLFSVSLQCCYKNQQIKVQNGVRVALFFKQKSCAAKLKLQPGFRWRSGHKVSFDIKTVEIHWTFKIDRGFFVANLTVIVISKDISRNLSIFYLMTSRDRQRL